MLAADLNAVDTVVTDDATPAGVVEIQDEDLAGTAVYSEHQSVERAGDFVVGADRVQEFVAEPAPEVEPVFAAFVRGEREEVVQEETWVLAGFGRKRRVERKEESGAAAGAAGLKVAKRPVGWKLEVVLDDLAGESCGEGVPYLAIAIKFVCYRDVERGVATAYCGNVLNVAIRGMDIDDVGLEFGDGLCVVDCFFVEEAVLGLVKCRLETAGEKQHFPEVDELAGGRATEDGDANFLEAGEC